MYGCASKSGVNIVIKSIVSPLFDPSHFLPNDFSFKNNVPPPKCRITGKL